MFKNNKNISFYNYPQKISLKDYTRAKSDLLEFYATIPEVKSVYSFGTSAHLINDLGISDLDMIPIVENTSKSMLAKIQEFENSDPLYGYVFHKQFGVFINEFCFKNIRRFFCGPSFDYYYEIGKKIDLRKNTKNENVPSNIMTIFGRDIQLQLIRINNYFQSGHIDVRQALKLLHSQKHISALFKVMGRDINSQDNFNRQVKELRGNWFSTNHQERESSLLKLLNENKRVMRENIENIANFLIDNKFDMFYENGREDLTIKTSSNDILLFSDKLWRICDFPVFNVHNSSLQKYLPKNIRQALELTCWNVLVYPKVILAPYVVHACLNDHVLGGRIRAQLPQELLNSVDKSKIPFRSEFQTLTDINIHHWNYLARNNLQYCYSSMLQNFIPRNQKADNIAGKVRQVIRNILTKIHYFKALRKISKAIKSCKAL